jgi:Uma2 family endonuclease
MSTLVEAKHGEERFLLTGIRWDFYKAFCDELDGRHIRLTYDRGNLEIMITKRPHEYYKKILAKIVEQIVLHDGIPVASGGSMTFQRDDLEKGMEPDECWWLAHEAAVRGREELDFQHDPPPDLVVEVEITRSLVSRVSIYAALRVPEIWRFNGRKLRFCVLEASGEYRDAPHSRAFPFLQPADLEPFLVMDRTKDETTRVREFVEWLEKRGGKPPACQPWPNKRRALLLGTGRARHDLQEVVREDRRAPVLLDVFDDQLGAARVADVGRLSWVVHGVG